MNFQASNLDGAYSTINSLHSLATGTESNNGLGLVSTLEEIINSLKVHWIGNDAMVHINNLIDIRDGLFAIVRNVTVIAHNASDAIVYAQEIRKSNGGTGNVGTVLSVYDAEKETIADVESTEQYYVDPTGAPNDYILLQSFSDNFDTFYTLFDEEKNALMKNWTAGANYSDAKSQFEQFDADVASYKTSLNDALTNLGTATTNLKNLGGTSSES